METSNQQQKPSSVTETKEKQQIPFLKHSEVLAELRQLFGTKNPTSEDEKTHERVDINDNTIEITFLKKIK